MLNARHLVTGVITPVLNAVHRIMSSHVRPTVSDCRAWTDDPRAWSDPFPTTRRGRTMTASLWLAAALACAQVGQTTEPVAANPDQDVSRQAENVPPPRPAASKITDVTVYQGQALVTREVSVPEGDGTVELVVTPLPPQTSTARSTPRGRRPARAQHPVPHPGHQGRHAARSSYQARTAQEAHRPTPSGFRRKSPYSKRTSGTFRNSAVSRAQRSRD